jgi:hypothetical protein
VIVELIFPKDGFPPLRKWRFLMETGISLIPVFITARDVPQLPHLYDFLA